MTSPEAVLSTKHVRAYRLLAFLVLIGLVVAFVLGSAGVTGPGLLTPESAFLAAGVAILVVAAALVYVLVTYRHAFTRLQVQHAMLKALESDLRKAGAELQSVQRQASTDRARIGGLEPRIAHLNDQTGELAPRVQSIEHRQRLLQDTTAGLGKQLTDTQERHDSLATLHIEQSSRINDLAERFEGLEYANAKSTAENQQRTEWLASEIAEHAKNDAHTAEHLARLQDDIAKLADDLAALGTRVEQVESEEDSQDYRFVALDQRIAVLELEVANAPRLTRSLETRVVELETTFQDHLENANESPENGTQPVKFEVVAQNSDGVGRLERRIDAIEARNVARDEQVARIESEFAAHAKHPVGVTIADLKAPTVVPPIQGDDDLAAVEGIGPVFRARLRENGIRSYNELRAADAETLGPKIGTRPKTVRGWQAMSELMQINGIDHQVAELLVRIGITSREVLAQSSPRSILEKANAYNERHEISLHPRTLDEALAKRWVDAAQPKLVATMG